MKGPALEILHDRAQIHRVCDHLQPAITVQICTKMAQRRNMSMYLVVLRVELLVNRLRKDRSLVPLLHASTKVKKSEAKHDL